MAAGGGHQELEGGLTDLQIFSQVPIFHICRDLTTKPKEEGRLGFEPGNLRGVSSNHYERESSQ